jgi:hypothetical protein
MFDGERLGLIPLISPTLNIARRTRGHALTGAMDSAALIGLRGQGDRSDVAVAKGRQKGSYTSEVEQPTVDLAFA